MSESHGRLEVEGGLANNAGAEATVTRFGVKYIMLEMLA